MATLIVASSIIQFVLASRLSLMRRLFTPVVAGTMIMLIAVSVMPVVLDILNDVPEGTAEEGALIAGLVLRTPPALRLWSPVIGIVAGSLAGRHSGCMTFSRYSTRHGSDSLLKAGPGLIWALA